MVTTFNTEESTHGRQQKIERPPVPVDLQDNSSKRTTWLNMTYIFKPNQISTIVITDKEKHFIYSHGSKRTLSGQNGS